MNPLTSSLSNHSPSSKQSQKKDFESIKQNSNKNHKQGRREYPLPNYLSEKQELKKNLVKEFENILYLFQNSLINKNLSLPPQEEKNKEKIIHKIINENSSEKYKQRILSEFSGFGPLDPLLPQSDINEIIINGKDHIFYEKNGKIRPLDDCFLSEITFHNIVEKIGTQTHVTVNLKKPFAEGKWGPFRIIILRPPIVKEDFHLCLRRQTQSLWTFEKLEKQNWAPQFAIQTIRQFVQDQINFLVVGATSSGKTSILNACLQETKAYERIVSIEDTDEIMLPNATSMKLLTQNDPESSKALITQQDLVRQSLRLRPDRIVMGEVRGGEAKDLLLALATGHKGSIGTLHGNDHKQALWKLETLAHIGAPQWNSSTIQKLIFSSLQALVVLEKREDMRLLKGIYRITTLETTGFLFESLYEREEG